MLLFSATNLENRLFRRSLRSKGLENVYFHGKSHEEIHPFFKEVICSRTLDIDSAVKNTAQLRVQWASGGQNSACQKTPNNTL